MKKISKSFALTVLNELDLPFWEMVGTFGIRYEPESLELVGILRTHRNLIKEKAKGIL